MTSHESLVELALKLETRFNAKVYEQIFHDLEVMRYERGYGWREGRLTKR